MYAARGVGPTVPGMGWRSGAGVETAAALALLDDHRQRRRDHARQLWTLLVLAEWFAWLGTQSARRAEGAAPAARSRFRETGGTTPG